MYIWFRNRPHNFVCHSLWSFLIFLVHFHHASLTHLWDVTLFTISIEDVITMNLKSIKIIGSFLKYLSTLTHLSFSNKIWSTKDCLRHKSRKSFEVNDRCELDDKRFSIYKNFISLDGKHYLCCIHMLRTISKGTRMRHQLMQIQQIKRM